MTGLTKQTTLEFCYNVSTIIHLYISSYSSSFIHYFVTSYNKTMTNRHDILTSVYMYTRYNCSIFLNSELLISHSGKTLPAPCMSLRQQTLTWMLESELLLLHRYIQQQQQLVWWPTYWSSSHANFSQHNTNSMSN